jgi:plasmid stabilization system protein ParE
MTLPIDFRLEVLDEVDAAYQWYEQQRAGLGEEFLTALVDQIGLIEENPELFGVLHRKIRACALKRFPYVIYYRLMPDRIDVIAVQHGHRKPSAWRRRA